MGSFGKVEKSTTWLLFTIVLISVITSIYPVYKNNFITDDAFISFRYALNFIQDNGLVYNPGEYVEGYTNFLWVMIIAFFMSVGVDPVFISKAIGIGAYVVMIIALNLFCFSFIKILNKNIRFLDIFPLFTLLLLPLNESSAAWATGGLETSFFVLFAVLAFFTSLLFRDKRSVYFVSNLFFLILCLTRPDGILFYFVINIFIIIENIYNKKFTLKKSIVDSILWNIPFLTLFSLFMIWKLYYYGSILPNTFYAKSAALSYYSSGYRYVELFFNTYVAMLVIFIVIPAPFIYFAILKILKINTGELGRIILFKYFPIVTMVCLFIFYIMRVGGDCMEFRFIMHIYPLIVSSICICIIMFNHKFNKFRIISPVLILILLYLTYSCSTQDDLKVRWLDVINKQNNFKLIGTKLKEKLPADTIIAAGAVGAVPFYSELKTIDILGLTDKITGRKKLKKRTVVGHEKRASKKYLRERGANFIFRSFTAYPCEEIPQSGESDSYVGITLDNGYCIKAKYLKRNKILTDYLMAHPDYFILKDIF